MKTKKIMSAGFAKFTPAGSAKFKIMLVIIVALSIFGCHVKQQMGALPDTAVFEGISYFDEGQFTSPAKIEYFPERATGKGGRGRFLFKSDNAPEQPLLKVMLTKISFPDAPEQFALYWLGHSSAILELDGKRIFIDPVLSNASPVPGTVKHYDVSPIERKELPEADYVLISHDHYDHLEYSTMKFLKDRDIQFIVPLGVDVHLIKWGIPKERIHTLGWGDTFTDGSISITAEIAVHYSGRTRGNRNKALWASYIIAGQDNKVFWSGDTGYSQHFKEIGKKYGPFDLAAVEMDGWNDGWPNIHLFPDEAVQAVIDVNATYLLPTHWAVFDLARHPWDESIQMIVKIAEELNVEVVTPMMGQRVVPGVTKTEYWWE